jgi:sodium/pantothenate symporter
MASNAQIIGTWLLIAFYMLVIIYFVWQGSKKIKNISDYAVGNINFSPASVGLSLAASMTSAATFIVNPGFIANYGLSGVLSFGVIFPIAALSSLVILTKSFRKYGAQVKALTLAQWIGKRYNSKNYALTMAILSLLLITFIVLIVVAITKVLAKALNANEIWVLGITITFIFGYMMFGGANSMVYTNTIQAVIMIIVAFILLFSGYEYFEGGISGLLDKLNQINPKLTQWKNPESLLFRDYYEIIFAQAIIGIAVVVQPHIITKSLLLKKESDVNRYLLVAVLVEILFFSVVFAGLYARLHFPDLTANGVALKNDGIIPAYVVSVFSNGMLAIIVGLIVVMGLISAGLSTLEGLIQSVSSSIITDIIKPIFPALLKEGKSEIKANKIAIILLAIISFFIAYDQILYPKLSVGILAQNGVYAYFSAAFIPVLFGIFIKNAKTMATFTATLVAIAVHFGVYYFLPYLVEIYQLNFGFFTKFLQGDVRNPAIAASSAIIVSTITGLLIQYSSKNSISTK